MVAGPYLRRHLEGHKQVTAAVEAVRHSHADAVAPAFSKGLLFTGTAPGEPGVGGVILKDLIRHTGVDHWHCCWLASKHGPQEPYWKELPTTVQRRQYETGYRPVRGITGEVVSAVALKVLRAPMIAAACQSLQKLAQEVRPDFVLAVLESPAAIETAWQLQRSLKIPLRCIVWDDVDLFCRQSHFDRWTRSRIENAFAEVLKNSERTAVICENMQTEYRRRYGIESFVLRHGVVSRTDAALSDEDTPSEVYRIGFAGSVTAPDCMRSLIEGLDSVGWRINSREVVLRLLGARYLLDSRKPQRIEYFGWRSVEETCSRLSECDLLYLPQSFTQENRTFSELSFPTKLSTYVTARRPILLHAPDYASLSGFWKHYAMGPVCDQCDASRALASVSEGLLSQSAQRQQWVREIGTAHEQALGVQQFQHGVEHLVSSKV